MTLKIITAPNKEQFEERVNDFLANEYLKHSTKSIQCQFVEATYVAYIYYD